MDILGLAGPWLLLIIVGGWIFLMNAKKGWSWTQVIAGMLLLAALYGQFPTLPASINTGLSSVLNSVTK